MNNYLEKPIVFFGAPRSGTTIVSEIVLHHFDLAWPSNRQNRHPRFKQINYLRRLFDNRHWRLIGKKHSLAGNPFYNELLFKPDESYGMWAYLVRDDVDFGRGFLLDDKASLERQNSIRQYFAYLVRAQGKKRLAFKITGPPRMGYLLSLFPDAIFIRIRRSLVPTMSSLMKTRFWQSCGQSDLWWTGVYSAEEKAWAERHCDSPELMTAFQLNKIAWAEREEESRYAPDVLDVCYETFTTDPEKEIHKILDFCGLPFDSKVFEYLRINPVVQRNKPDSDYFAPDVLLKIDKFLQEAAEK